MRAATVFRMRWATGLGFYLAVAVVLAVTLFPLYWVFATSIKTLVQQFTYPPLFFFEPTLDNYTKLLRSKRFLLGLWNSTQIAVWSTLLTVFAGSLAAYAFTRFRFWGASFMSSGILISRMFPSVALALPIYVLASQLRLLDTIPIVVMGNVTHALPFALWLMIGFFSQVPMDLDDAARIDGCSWFSAYWRILLPTVAPGLVATSILTFIYNWNEFFWALVLTNRFAKPAVVMVTEFVYEEGIEWGLLMASALSLVLPTLLFALIAQRYLVSGLTAGAVKG